MRTQRASGSTVYAYIYDGSNLNQMTVGSNALIFTYGINGQPMSVKYNGVDYYYVTNSQGDVVGILNGSGTEVVTYTYDAWGNILSTAGSMANTLGAHNPLRYRGYVYDQETGLYYLQSRYYNPAICRFISADGVGYLGADGTVQSYNLFAYCSNNPVGYEDNSGCAAETVLDAISIADSFLQLIRSPSWANAGYLIWDVGATFLPLAPGSYIAKGGKILAKIDNFADGSKFLTGTYNKLKTLYKGFKEIEIHHLIEKRFKNLFSVKPGDFLSIPLTKEAHRIFTNRWRNLHKLGEGFEFFKYGSNYSKITKSMMEKAVNTVYGDMPELLEQVLDWLAKNWGH